MKIIYDIWRDGLPHNPQQRELHRTGHHGTSRPPPDDCSHGFHGCPASNRTCWDAYGPPIGGSKLRCWSVSGPWPDTDALTTRLFLPSARPLAGWRDGPSCRPCRPNWRLRFVQYITNKLNNNIVLCRVKNGSLSLVLST